MTEKFFLGTYTKRVSKGIYSVQLDTVKKQFSNLTLEAEIENPTYLALNADRSLLAAVSKEESGGITVFNTTQAETLTKVSHYHDTTAVPCYIAFNKESNHLLAANYHEGHVSSYKFDVAVTLADRVIHPSLEEKQPHVHYTDYTPDEKWIVVCDLGSDIVATYQQDGEKLQRVSTYYSKKGAGPRHLAFHPTLPIAYLICELNASIEVLAYDAKNGSFTFIEQHLLTTTEQQAWGGAIHLTTNGKFLYASNRGYDRIYVFQIQENTGLLTFVADYDTFGSVPRDFHLSKDERFIVIGHQESDNLTLYERNIETGTLTLCQKDFFAPEVVCVIPF